MNSLAHLQPDISNDGLYTNNYYTCFIDNDTDAPDVVDNTNMDDEYKKYINLNTNDGNNTNTGAQLTSQASSLHVISILTPPLSPLLVPLNNDKYHGTINNNGNVNNNNGNDNNNGKTTHPMYLQHKMMTHHYHMNLQLSDHFTHDPLTLYSIWNKLTHPIFQWTRQHLDSFFALAEMACKWNIDPG